ncbi:peptidase M16 [Roseibium aquae]|uniref:Peptidase M16 n=2 Tax=Roseibium aquae TaxID=1323746 RepID=A0A916TKK0_9HYPH|nr:peptidase M16 [Roseibium aquae]
MKLSRFFSIALTTGFLGLVFPAHAVEIQRVVSPGGIEAWLVEDDTVPIIAMNFAFEGGTAQDPDGKEGVTQFMTAMLDEGAGELDSIAYKTRLEDLAIGISFSADRDHVYGSLRTLTTTRDEAFDMLALAVNSPRFDAEPLDRVRAQMVSNVRREEQEPDAVAGKVFMDAMFGDHPYAKPSGGTLETLGSMSGEDLETQKTRVFATGTLTVGVVGAIDAQTLAPLLDKVFTDLPAEPDLAVIADVDPNAGAQVHVTLDTPQTTVLFGLPGLKRDDPDYQAAFVMNHILGGGSFTSWLYEEVREKRGLTYGVYSYLAPYEHTGMLSGSASTRADRAGETVAVILDQIQRMASEGPTEDELASAKRFLTGSYGLRFDTSAKIARQLVALKIAGLGIDYFDRRNAEIEAVTLADVQRAAKRLLEGQQPTIVSVGPVDPKTMVQ